MHAFILTNKCRMVNTLLLPPFYLTDNLWEVSAKLQSSYSPLRVLTQARSPTEANGITLVASLQWEEGFQQSGYERASAEDFWAGQNQCRSTACGSRVQGACRAGAVSHTIASSTEVLSVWTRHFQGRGNKEWQGSWRPCLVQTHYL